ncbi:AI-2E family transporter [Pseudomonas sp. CFBP 13719]|uniref:AI-2E family transporter n=1 Tax=Pseudomonas sp. CFBP 13719 TaxID=2775303 RepID=UPI00178655A1|nr:AI-2E family transporter [Pseudomonas sp. CFBP 13719]MBD8681418.1 AI-2E family transporter [Pseudomonas sp. CFBP 13719]
MINQLEKPIGIALIVGVLLAALYVLSPFAITLAWGALIAFATWPAVKWLERLTGRLWIAASVISLLLITIVVGPLVALTLSFAGDATVFTHWVMELAKSTLPDSPGWVAKLPWVGGYVDQQWAVWHAKGPTWFMDVKPYLTKILTVIVGKSGVLGSVLAQIGLSILFAFWFHLEGEKITTLAHKALNALIGQASSRYWEIARNTISGVINGVIGTALAQAVLALIGFWIAGVPGALLLGVGTFFLSLIPMGPPILWLPAAGWLFYQGEVGYAIFLAIWGIFIVSGVDNILKPILISRGGVLPLPIVLIGVFGGVLSFGFLGLFLGPVFLALSFTLVREWLNQRAATSSTPAP